MPVSPGVTGLGMALQACPGIAPAERRRLEELKQAGLRLFGEGRVQLFTFSISYVLIGQCRTACMYSIPSPTRVQFTAWWVQCPLSIRGKVSCKDEIDSDLRLNMP
jgi:hypothetical protein